jgi:hypothetical protein
MIQLDLIQLTSITLPVSYVKGTVPSLILPLRIFQTPFVREESTRLIFFVVAALGVV